MLHTPYARFAFSMLIFGSNGIVASHIPLSSYEIVLCRTVLGGSCLLLFALWQHELGQLLHQGRRILWLLIAGLALAGNWLFLYEAYQQVGVSLATLLCYAGPILVMILSRFVFGEAFTVPRVAGIVLVTLGMVCINGVDFQAHGLSWGMACGFLSATCFAILVISVKKVQGLSGLVSSAAQLLIASVVVAIVNLSAPVPDIHLSLPAIGWICLLGFINTGFACCLYFTCIQALSAQTVSICGYIEPLSALAFSAIFLGETLTLLQWLGAVLVLGGVGVAELRGHRIHVQRN